MNEKQTKERVKELKGGTDKLEIYVEYKEVRRPT